MRSKVQVTNGVSAADLRPIHEVKEEGCENHTRTRTNKIKTKESSSNQIHLKIVLQYEIKSNS